MRLQNATVRFGTRSAIDDVSLDFAPGTSTALVGANGSGKSTMLNLLAGLLAPTSGSVESPPSEVAYVLQQGRASRWLPLTVDEVLRMSRYRRRLGLARLTDEDHNAIEAAAVRLDIDRLRGRQFGQLSGGERQRVLVAQALAQQAAVLLLDEAISGLDIPSQGRILDVLDDEANAGHTVVLSTHSLDEAHHCDQVALLANRLVAVGPPEQVLTPDVLRSAYDERLGGAHAEHDHPGGLVLMDEHGC